MADFDTGLLIQLMRKKSFLNDVRHTFTERGLLSKWCRKLSGRRWDVKEISITFLYSVVIFFINEEFTAAEFTDNNVEYCR
jgi:hypothetical protein